MRKPAKVPNDLERYFVERANAGDIEGLVALYESNAIVAYGDGEVAIGLNEIRDIFVKFLGNRLARRQPDGSWLWVVDQFAVSGEE